MATSDPLQDLRDYLNESATITTDSQLRNYVKTTCGLTLEGDALPVKVDLHEAEAYIGQQVGLTKWFPLSQKRMNRFADAVGDYQFLHIDKARTARETCYDGTIAHGLMVMSLIPTFATHASLKIRGTQQTIIYGMDRVRFLNPVRLGSRIRGRFTLLSVEERGVNEVLLRHSVVIEVENQEKPALITDWIILAVL